jgi:uncharacterized protein
MPQNEIPPDIQQVLQQLRQLKPYLHERWGVNLLAVFGSVARGEATPESDVDILFDYDKPIGLEIVTLGDYLEDQLGCKVDLLSKKAIRSKVWPYIKDDMRYV